MAPRHSHKYLSGLFRFNIQINILALSLIQRRTCYNNRSYVRMSINPDIKNDYIPDLLPFHRKMPSEISTPLDDLNKQKTQQNIKATPNLDSKSKQAANDIKSQVKDGTTKRKQNNRENNEIRKRNQISKALINQMIKKISVKSITEQNYPVSNQTLQRVILELDVQIGSLSAQIAKLESSLAMNPTNQHLKRQIKGVQKSLNQIQTIKELYIQKGENRNKISELQSKVTELKGENRELKIKIARGIQKIQSHIHNLPCERQKLLIQELNKYKQELDREKKMRFNLEGNIRAIVLNFKRFYVEADEARKIITSQLKQINQKKQQALRAQKGHSRLEANKNASDSHPSNAAKANNFQKLQNKPYSRDRYEQEENMPQLINQIVQAQRPDESDFRKLNVKGGSSYKRTNLQQEKQTSKKGFNLEDQIKKMRTNQTLFSKLSKRNL